MSRIFQKLAELKPATLAGVAEKRLADAQALFDMQQNQHLNAAVYLAGFAVEILLKARLVAKHAHIARKPQYQVKEDEREIWNLIWRSHDLEDMLSHLPDLESALRKQDERCKSRHWEQLKGFCGTWTVHARYSPHTIERETARDYIGRIKAFKEYLK